MPDEDLGRDAQTPTENNPVEIDPAVLLQRIEAMERERDEWETHKRKLNEEAMTRRQALEKEQKEREAERARMLAEQGEYKKLYEESLAKLEQLTPYRERYETVQAQIAQSNEEKVKRLPEEYHVLVPKNLTPEELSVWLDSALPRLTKPTAPNLDAGAMSTGGRVAGPKLTPEQREMAQRMGLTPEQYAKYLEQ